MRSKGSLTALKKGISMSDFNRVVLAPVELVPILSFRFVLRCALCLALTALNAGVVEYAGAALYRATDGHPLQMAGVSLFFAALLGSLVRVWIVAFRARIA